MRPARERLTQAVRLRNQVCAPGERSRECDVLGSRSERDTDCHALREGVARATDASARDSAKLPSDKNVRRTSAHLSTTAHYIGTQYFPGTGRMAAAVRLGLRRLCREVVV